MRLVVGVLFVVFTGINGEAQTIWDSPLRTRCRVVIGKEIWGTDWDSFVFESRFKESSEIDGVVHYSGWSSFSEGGMLCGIYKDLSPNVIGWVELGGELESFPEIDLRTLQMRANLGATYEGDLCQTFFECSILDTGVPWRIEANYKEGRIAVGVGLWNLNATTGWMMSTSVNFSSIKFFARLESPSTSIQLGFTFKINDTHFSTIHRHILMGGSTKLIAEI